MTIKKKLEEFKKQWLGKWYDEGFGYQCVAWVKKAVEEIYGIKLGSFGGTAVSGWENIKNTFDPSVRKKTEYKGISWPIADLTPPVWAVIFWHWTKDNKAWHVAIVSWQVSWPKVLIIEQNGWWPGSYHPWDVLTERVRTLSGVAGRYTFRRPKSQLRRSVEERKTLDDIRNKLKYMIDTKISNLDLKFRAKEIATQLFLLSREKIE